jgi:hypothetical protein
MQQSIAPSVGPRVDASAGQSRQSSSTGMQSINYQKKWAKKTKNILN